MYDFDSSNEDEARLFQIKQNNEKEDAEIRKHIAMLERHKDWLCKEVIRLKNLCGEEIVLNRWNQPVYSLNDWAGDNIEN